MLCECGTANKKCPSGCLYLITFTVYRLGPVWKMNEPCMNSFSDRRWLAVHREICWDHGFMGMLIMLSPRILASRPKSWPQSSPRSYRLASSSRALWPQLFCRNGRGTLFLGRMSDKMLTELLFLKCNDVLSKIKNN